MSIPRPTLSVASELSRNTTELGSLVVAREMQMSSMSEHLIQIVQILQLRRHHHSNVHFAFPSSYSEAKYALKARGFTCVDVLAEEERAVTSKRILKMAKCSSYRFG